MAEATLLRPKCGLAAPSDVWWVTPTAIIALALTAANGATCASDCAPLLVWNASSSSPPGLYAFESGRARRGDFVIARAPPRFARLAARRGYLPKGVPLVKTLAARSGDRVCAAGDRLSINGRALAVRRRTDAAGRALPRWSGCRNLGPGEVLLLGLAHPSSFDGRYFGPTRESGVLARVRLVWRG